MHLRLFRDICIPHYIMYSFDANINLCEGCIAFGTVGLVFEVVAILMAPWHHDVALT